MNNNIDYKQCVMTPGPLTYEHFIVIGELNSYVERMTDCSRTYDYMMERRDKIEKSLQGLSTLILFEIALKLNKNGIKNLWENFHNCFGISTNPWKNKRIIEDIRFIYERNTKI